MTTTAPETEIRFSIGQTPDRLARHIATRMEILLDEVDGKIPDAPHTGGDPLVAEKLVNDLLKGLKTEVRSHVLTWTRATAQATARRVGIPGYKTKWSIREIAAGLALVATSHDGYEDIARLRQEIEQRATNVRIREYSVEEAGRNLRYWAGLDIAMTYPNMRTSTAPSVEAVLKFYGLAYLRWRGEEAEGLWPEQEPVEDVETAIRRVGNLALGHLISPDWGRSENMMEQLRLGQLMGAFYQDMAARVVVRLTHGSLDQRRKTDIWIEHADASEYVPGWGNASQKERDAYEGLAP